MAVCLAAHLPLAATACCSEHFCTDGKEFSSVGQLQLKAERRRRKEEEEEEKEKEKYKAYGG